MRTRAWVLLGTLGAVAIASGLTYAYLDAQPPGEGGVTGRYFAVDDTGFRDRPIDDGTFLVTPGRRSSVYGQAWQNPATDHWVQAVGIVDGDGRSAEEREAMVAKGVHPLAVSEVESLYYLPAVVAAVAVKLAAIDGDCAEKRLHSARAAGISALTANNGIERIAKKLAMDEISRSLVRAAPSEVTDSEIHISLPSPYSRIKNKLEELHAANDYENLVRIASIRDSGFRGSVAKALGIDRTDRYQKIAAVAIATNPDLVTALRGEVADRLFDLHEG